MAEFKEISDLGPYFLACAAWGSQESLQNSNMAKDKHVFAKM